MKLKTLKDLEYNVNGCDEVLVSELKAEAVKWVKELKSSLPEGMRIDIFRQSQKYTFVAINAKIRWIIDFLNLTSEDLK